MKRRAFLKCTLTGGIVVAGLTSAKRGMAEGWPSPAFKAKTVSEVLDHLYRKTQATPSSAIRITAPMQTTGGTVPVIVKSQLKEVDSIAIVAEGNECPLSTLIKTPHADGYYSCYIRLAKTSAVTAFVHAGGKLYSNFTQVKVTVGGYGMHGELAEDNKSGSRFYGTRVWCRKNGDGETEVVVLVNHPMISEAEWRDRGACFAGHFIKTMAFYVNGMLAADALFGPNVASNPVARIALPTAKAGDTVTVKWRDSKGLRGGNLAKIT